MSLINKEKLESEMYHNAFEIDTDLQKWDRGCWIRYKMFENVIEKQPTVDAEPVVRCKDCRFFYKYGFKLVEYTECTHFDCDVTENGYCWWGERK